METVLSTLGPQLKNLSVAVGVTEFGDVVNGRYLPHLQELKLEMSMFDDVPLSANDLSGLSSLVSLKKFTLEQ